MTKVDVVVGAIEREVRDGVGWVTIARPAKRNALTRAMWCGLSLALAELGARDDVVGIVIQGADGTFAAGADLEDVLAATASRVQAEAYCSEVVTALLAVASCPVPTLALVSGVAAGGGAEIAIAADVRFADPSASFAFPFARLGVTPDRFTLARLAGLIGPSAARRVVCSGETLDAARAHGLGLVDEVVDPREVVASCIAWADALRHGSRRARADMKRALLEPDASSALEVGVASLVAPLVESFLSGDVEAAARRFLRRA